MNKQATQLIVPSLERATHTVALWIERTLGDLGISQAEAHILAHLARTTGTTACTINDLHRGFGHKRSTLTSLLDRLEGRGLVRRGPHPTSRRLITVTLTESGRAFAQQVDATLRAMEDRIAARVGAADVGAFLRVIAALEQEIEEDVK
jgi:DNA-binding MarR family transcriptional regulator